jgi:chromosome segregation ATPase
MIKSLQTEGEWHKKWQAAEQLAAKERDNTRAAQRDIGALEGRICVAHREAEQASGEAANARAEARDLRLELAKAYKAVDGAGVELSQRRRDWEAEIAASRQEAAAMMSAHSSATSEAAELVRRLAAVTAAQETADVALVGALEQEKALKLRVQKQSQQIAAVEASLHQNQARFLFLTCFQC